MAQYIEKRLRASKMSRIKKVNTCFKIRSWISISKIVFAIGEVRKLAFLNPCPVYSLVSLEYRVKKEK